MDRDAIEALAELMARHGLAELELETGGSRLRLRRFEGPAPAAASAPRPGEPASEAEPAEPPGEIVRAPMVGTFYRSPEPGAPPFVEVGDRVEVGQVLCIVEAMKLMNELESEVAGTVAAVLVEDGAPVQYGQPLFRVLP